MPKRNGAGIELLADPTRRRIVALLALSHRRPSKLADEIGLSRPATTRQLRLLARAGLITSRRGYVDRRSVVYYIDPVRLGQITAWLAGTEVGRQFAPPLTPWAPTTISHERNDLD
ncbi:MAG TPA: metalloregulator ArsR/SmtB family transcription factor [Candidatus Limnocylindrales bacterium]|jgi:DNA-binding transcriptional ArsR family regulator|nr:metalloregulator ArsR/SmtB family transcription factor [Candidatus Limnocylindrales bacterium]